LIISIAAVEIDFEIGYFRNLSDLRDLDLDPGSGHTAYRSVSLADIYQISLKSEKHLVDRRTLRPASLGRVHTGDKIDFDFVASRAGPILSLVCTGL